jgi:Leucine-rich repeat (LRR) protein
MKKFSLFAFLSMVLFSLTVLSCKKDDDGDNSDDGENGANLNNLKTGQVEIKGYAGRDDKKMSFKAIAKTITIDWGDGKIEEITPNGVEKTFSHEYANSTDFQTILINTEDLTEIGFETYYNRYLLHELRFGNCPKLEDIYCYSSGYSSHSSIELPSLTVFEINKAELLTTLSIGTPGSSATGLTSLNLNGCTALEKLSCTYNSKLTSLDVSKCTALTELSCHSNQLTSLDVSKCTALTYLSCSDNQLTSLDVSKCTALTSLSCSYNTMYGSSKLISLNVSGCTALTSLGCSSNQLTSLDVSKCTALTELWCYGNQLNAAALNSLFNSLPAGKEYIDYGQSRTSTIYIGGNPGSNDCDTSIAENKGWDVSNW